MSKHSYLSSSKAISMTKRGSIDSRESETAPLQEPKLTLTGAIESQKSLTPARHASGCYSIRFAPGGGALAAGFGNGAVLLYEKDDQEAYTKQSTLRKGSRFADDTIMAVRFHPKQGTIIFSCAVFGEIFQHNVTGLPDEKCGKFCEENNNRINAIDLNMTGEMLASGGKDLNLRVYDIQTKQLIQEYSGFHRDEVQTEPGGHALSVFCIKFHPDQRDVMLTGGWDDSVKIWDMRRHTGMVGSLAGPHICGDAIDIRGETVVTGSWRAAEAIQLWDLRQRTQIKALSTLRKTRTEGDNLYAVQFARSDPDGQHLLTAGSGTNSFQYINHTTGEVLGTGTSEKPFTTVDSRGETLAAAGGDGWIRLFQVSNTGQQSS